MSKDVFSNHREYVLCIGYFVLALVLVQVMFILLLLFETKRAGMDGHGACAVLTPVGG